MLVQSVGFSVKDFIGAYIRRKKKNSPGRCVIAFQYEKHYKLINYFFLLSKKKLKTKGDECVREQQWEIFKTLFFYSYCCYATSTSVSFEPV